MLLSLGLGLHFLYADMTVGEDDDPWPAIRNVTEDPNLPDSMTGVFRTVNERDMKNVTARNNVVIPMMITLGNDFFYWGQVDWECQQLMFQILQIPQKAVPKRVLKLPSSEPQRFASDGLFVYDAINELLSRYKTLQWQPWKSQQHPELADWLDENRIAIDVLATATQRTKFYAPTIPPKTHDRPGSALMSVPLPMELASQMTSQILLLRAMQQENQAPFSDLMASHRIGLLLQQRSHLLSYGISFEILSATARAHYSYATNHSLSQTHAESCLSAVRSLPQLRPVSAVYHEERRSLYDSLQSYKDRYASQVNFTKLAVDGSLDIDMNEARAGVDSLIDPIFKSLQLEKRSDWKIAFAKATQNLISHKELLTPSAVTSGKMTFENWFGRTIAYLISPSAQQSRESQDHLTAQRDMITLCYALQAYRAKHSQYPTNLGALTPRFLPSIPIDPFTNEAYEYRVDTDRMTLSSGGSKEDQPKITPPFDQPAQPAGDHLRVEFDTIQVGN